MNQRKKEQRDRYYPDFEGFKQLSIKGNIIPVYRQLIADTLTPVSAFQKISDAEFAFLLESAAGGEKISRYSILGINPFVKFTSYGQRIELKRGINDAEVIHAKDPLEVLNKEMRAFTPVSVNGLPKFFCCVVGYIGYDTIRYY